jgi:hypothetical protein
MTREEIEHRLVEDGWEIEERSSPDLIVGRFGALSILAYEFLTRGDEPEFQLIDSERLLVCWVRMIPPPRVALALLEECAAEPWEGEAG